MFTLTPRAGDIGKEKEKRVLEPMPETMPIQEPSPEPVPEVVPESVPA